MSQPLIAAAVIIAAQSRWALRMEAALHGGLDTIFAETQIVAAEVLMSPSNPQVQITVADLEGKLRSS